MQAKDLLQGKPLKHPLHPILIHFPIGLFILSLVLDLIRPWAGSWTEMGALVTMALGVMTAILAAVPGGVDYGDIRADHPAKKTATYHMVLNLLAVALYTVNLILRYGRSPVPTAALVLSFMGIGCLAVSGYLGGSLVYNHGIGVGRHRRQTPTPRRTIRVEQTDADGSAEVADTDSDPLPEGGTLRAEVNGYVMTVARVGGRTCAFQEFCTHRFGPLSEGTFEDGQVVCPWHRSRFDVQTGKVTHGPAKVDLRTFPAEERDGLIRVTVPRQRPG